jgi:hypothetical protein
MHLLWAGIPHPSLVAGIVGCRSRYGLRSGGADPSRVGSYRFALYPRFSQMGWYKPKARPTPVVDGLSATVWYVSARHPP